MLKIARIQKFEVFSPQKVRISVIQIFGSSQEMSKRYWLWYCQRYTFSKTDQTPFVIAYQNLPLGTIYSQCLHSFPIHFLSTAAPRGSSFFSSLAPDSMAPLAPQICPEDQSPSSAMSPQPRGAAKCILVEHPMVSPPSVNSHKTWDAKNICCHTCTILQYIAIYGDSTKYYNFTIYHIY